MAPGDLPATTRIGRTALVANDLDELAGFYRDVVGLAVLARDDHGATLGADGTALLELREDASAPRRSRSGAGLYHNAVRVPDRGALGDALERVRERWQPGGAADHAVSEALYLTDPEGNGVEVYRDRPRGEWPTADGRVRMVTDPLDLDALAADAAGDDGVPAGTDVGHVHLEVTDLDAARAFYVDALGMTVRQDAGSALFAAAGDYHHHVGLNTWHHRNTPRDGRGLDWFELVLPDAESTAAAVGRLADAGYEVRESDDASAATDHDGIEVRLRVDA